WFHGSVPGHRPGCEKMNSEPATQSLTPYSFPERSQCIDTTGWKTPSPHQFHALPETLSTPGLAHAPCRSGSSGCHNLQEQTRLDRRCLEPGHDAASKRLAPL